MCKRNQTLPFPGKLPWPAGAGITVRISEHRKFLSSTTREGGFSLARPHGLDQAPTNAGDLGVKRSRLFWQKEQEERGTTEHSFQAHSEGPSP